MNPIEKAPRPGSGWTRMGTSPFGGGTVYRRGDLTAISSLVSAEMPDGSGELGPQWLISFSVKGKRAKDNLVRRGLRDFGLLAAEEDNHHPGISRAFFLVCDPAHRVDCECKVTEEVVVEPNGHRWTNPTPAALAAGERCRGCELAPLSGRPCRFHGSAASAVSS